MSKWPVEGAGVYSHIFNTAAPVSELSEGLQGTAKRIVELKSEFEAGTRDCFDMHEPAANVTGLVLRLLMRVPMSLRVVSEPHEIPFVRCLVDCSHLKHCKP